MPRICPPRSLRLRDRTPSLAKRILTAPIAALAAALLAAAPATADDDAPLKKGGFQLSVGMIYNFDTVSVKTSPSGASIDPFPLKLALNGKIDFRWGNGFVERAGLFAGYCARTNCGANTLLWYRSADEYTGPAAEAAQLAANDWNFGFAITTTPQRLLSPAEQNSVMARCQENPQDEFIIPMTVTLSVNTRTDDTAGTDFHSLEETQLDIDEVEFNGGDQSRHAGFSVRVRCETTTHESATPTPFAPPNPQIGFDHGAMNVDDIKLTLTTYSNAYTEPTPGAKCKKAKLAVTLETNQAGPVSFRLWKQRGDGPIGSEIVNATAHHDGGRFFAVHERWVEVDETTNVQFNARDLVNEVFFKETGWKDITLHCTGAGGGGLTVNQGDDGHDIPIPQPKPKVNPAVGGGVGGLTAAPRTTHSGGNAITPILPLVCRGGTVSNGACACGPNKLRRKVGARDYQCVAVAKPPEQKKPLRVLPLPKQAHVVCKGGKVANGKCLCGASATAVKIGQASFACRKKTALRTDPAPKKSLQQPKRMTPKALKLVCKGGSVRGGKCGCAKGKVARKLGPAKFACVPRRG